MILYDVIVKKSSVNIEFPAFNNVLENKNFVGFLEFDFDHELFTIY